MRVGTKREIPFSISQAVRPKCSPTAAAMRVG